MQNSFKSEHCATCPLFFKLFNSCPNLAILETGTFQEIFIEFAMSISSAATYFAFFYTLFYGFYSKTIRGFCIGMAVIIQVCACELFKMIERQARPLGACADSFGYPSSHSSFTSTLFTW